MPSTVVAHFTYDPGSKVLRVTFTSGLVYDYKDVPEDVYAAMKRSGAKGVFLNEHIKNKYAFERITDLPGK